MSTLREDWQVLRALFPAEWEQLGRRSGAVQRLRGFASVENLLRTLLLHVGCGWSLRETAVHAKLADLASVSDVTLLNRLRQSEDWLRQLCQALWKENGVDLQPTLWGREVRVVDATTVKEPGRTGGQWRIHYSLRLPTLECDHFELTAAQGAHSGERLGRFRYRPGELILGDAGYSHPAGVAAVRQQQAHVCVRLNPYAMPLFDRGGHPLGLLQKLSDELRRAGQVGQWLAWIEADGKRLAGRVCALRKSVAAIERAQRQLREKHPQASLATQQYACYVLVFTTLPSEEASAQQVLECYRLRWQIELTFKRLKSIAQLGHVPKQDDHSTRAWLYGKLFVALLAQKLVHVGKTISPWGYCLPKETHPQPLA